MPGVWGNKHSRITLIQIRGLRFFGANRMSVFWFTLIHVGYQVPSLGGPRTLTFAPSATKQQRRTAQPLSHFLQMPLGQNWPRVLHRLPWILNHSQNLAPVIPYSRITSLMFLRIYFFFHILYSFLNHVQWEDGPDYLAQHYQS